MNYYDLPPRMPNGLTLEIPDEIPPRIPDEPCSIYQDVIEDELQDFITASNVNGKDVWPNEINYGADIICLASARARLRCGE